MPGSRPEMMTGQNFDRWYKGEGSGLDEAYWDDHSLVVNRPIHSRGPMMDVKAFGAVGDGTNDDTGPIQAAIDACPTNGTVDGGNSTFVVGSLALKSDMTLRNCRLKTRISAVDFVSPVTIGASGDATTKSNITLYNVHVNGNRANQTNIGATEDGGRHGFRVIGKVENLLIENCSAEYCASDGLCIYSNDQRAATDVAIIKHITVRNSRFNWNRRHGMSGDALQHVLFDGCTFDDNGQDVDGGLVEGNQGATVLADIYGTGITIEGYAVGSWIGDVVFRDCEALRNARSGLSFYDPTDQAATGWATRRNITIDHCTIDSGVNSAVTDKYALQFTGAPATKATASIYTNVSITDCDLQGALLLRSVNFVSIDGGRLQGDIGGGHDIAILDYALNVSIGRVEMAKRVYQTDSSVYYSVPLIGAAAWNATEIADAGVLSTTVTVTGALAGDIVSLGYSSANQSQLVISGYVSATDTVTVTVYNRAGYAWDPVDGLLTVFVWPRG